MHREMGGQTCACGDGDDGGVLVLARDGGDGDDAVRDVATWRHAVVSFGCPSLRGLIQFLLLLLERPLVHMESQCTS